MDLGSLLTMSLDGEEKHNDMENERNMLYAKETLRKM